MPLLRTGVRATGMVLATLCLATSSVALPPAVAAAGAGCPSRTSTTAHFTWQLSVDPDLCPGEPANGRGPVYKAITAFGSGFVAGGTLPAEGAETPHPASFTSSDGSVWTSHLLPTTIRGFGDPRILIAAGRGRLAFVQGTSALASTDGVTWAKATSAPTSGDLRTIVGDNRGFVAMGQKTLMSGRAVAWTSADGLRWTQVPDQPVLVRFCSSSLAVRGSRYVAVGTYCPTGELEILYSDNGRTWHLAPRPPAVKVDYVAPVVAAGPNGFVATTAEVLASRLLGNGFWASRDGLSWHWTAFFRISLQAGFAEEIRTVLAVPGGLLALGDRGASNDGGPPIAFFSATGEHWQRDGFLPNPGFEGVSSFDELTAAAATSSRVVGVGYFRTDAGAATEGATVWVGQRR
jgi:hypothetical protein